jgi:hypothetical protein
MLPQLQLLMGAGVPSNHCQRDISKTVDISTTLQRQQALIKNATMEQR